MSLFVFNMVDVDAEDLEAMARDIAAVFRKYGSANQCPPHLRAEREAELDRIRETFCACVVATNV